MYRLHMGLYEEIDDPDLLVFRGLDDENVDQIVCHCGRGRGTERTYPRLPQTAIHQRIALIGGRSSSASVSSQGSRSGRGRARILRDNAAALPLVGKSKTEQPRPADQTDHLERVNNPQKQPAGNWLQGEEFPALSVSNQQNTLNQGKETTGHEAQSFNSDLETENTQNTKEDRHLHEVSSNARHLSDTKELRINKNNFSRQSRLDLQKMLPEGFTLNRNIGNRNNRYQQHSIKNHTGDKKSFMDEFVLNDDLPDYRKFEVTHDDILKHKERTSKVPDTVKGKVSEWLRQLDDHRDDSQQLEGHRDDSHENNGESDDAEEMLVENDTDFKADVSAKEQNHSKDCEKTRVEKYSEVKNEDSFRNEIYEESSKETPVILKEKQQQLTNIEMEKNLFKELEEEINGLNGLNSTNDDENVCQNSLDISTSNIYVSDEESNNILDNIIPTALAHLTVGQTVNQNGDNGESVSSVSAESSKACLSESDFVMKYENTNKKEYKRKHKTLSSANTENMENVWRLDGNTVIQVDGLNRNCVLSHLEQMVAGFGTVTDVEKKANGDKLSVRFKLQTEDACEFAVQCLHDTDCIYPDSNSVLQCFKVD